MLLIIYEKQNEIEGSFANTDKSTLIYFHESHLFVCVCALQGISIKLMLVYSFMNGFHLFLKIFCCSLDSLKVIKTQKVEFQYHEQCVWVHFMCVTVYHSGLSRSPLTRMCNVQQHDDLFTVACNMTPLCAHVVRFDGYVTVMLLIL